MRPNTISAVSFALTSSTERFVRFFNMRSKKTIDLSKWTAAAIFKIFADAYRQMKRRIEKARAKK